MRKVIISFLCLGLLATAVAAQKKMKPWTEWSEKDALKMLNDSSWGQTQSEVDTSEMFFNPTSQGGGANSASRNSEGAKNQALGVNYRIRLMTAKPIRQAFARMIILKNPQMADQLTAFAEQKTDQYIVVAVDYDSTDRRLSGKVMQIFNSANTGMIQNSTYLEVKSGQRIFLKDYKAPINDGLGAKFVFPRMVDNEPFVGANSGYLRFYSELSKEIKLNMRFKISDMTYDGRLEY